jgi:hypothetical protein
MGTETLEEAAVLSSAVHFERTICSDGFYKTYQTGFKEGAKWQAERMYSEEEVLDMFHKFSEHLPFHYEFLVKTPFKKN